MPATDPLTGLPTLPAPPALPATPWLGSQATLDDSVANAVTNLSSKDSALNQMAATEGLKAANRRGLLNSSMAIGSAQDSVLKNVIPIAAQDAGQNFAKNQAARAFEYGMTAQTGEQAFESAQAAAQRAWQTSEALAGRSWQTGERLGSQEFTTGEREASQQFTSGERIATQDFQLTTQGIQNELALLLQNNELDATRANLIRQIASTEGIEEANNALQIFLQEKQQSWATGERVATQQFTTGERIGTQQFTLTRDDIQNKLQILLQNNELDAAQARLIMQINSTEGIEKANNALQLALQEKQQNWATGERLGTEAFAKNQNELDRVLERLLQSNQITSNEAMQARQISSTEGIESANRTLQLALQNDQQAWATGERIGTQQFQTLENRLNRAHESNENDLNRDLDLLMQGNQITAERAAQIRQINSTEGIERANRVLTEELAEEDIAFRMREGNLDRAAAVDAQKRDLAFNKEQNALARTLQSDIAKMNLEGTQQAGLAQSVSNTMGWYQGMYSTIMGNTALSAEQRTTQLTNAKTVFNTGMNLNEKMYNVDLKWPGETD